jgi:hypothetical protein
MTSRKNVVIATYWSVLTPTQLTPFTRIVALLLYE